MQALYLLLNKKQKINKRGFSTSTFEENAKIVFDINTVESIK